MTHNYGNIAFTLLKDVITNENFQKYWKIKKDEISGGKDCEFRHICTDCRAYLENPHDLHSKPLKCGYNPYTCKWQDWSINPIKKYAIEYYKMQSILK